MHNGTSEDFSFPLSTGEMTDIHKYVGPRALLVGVLRQAVADMVVYHGALDGREARKWIESEDRSELTCFATICDILEVESDFLRFAILKTVDRVVREGVHPNNITILEKLRLSREEIRRMDAERKLTQITSSFAENFHEELDVSHFGAILDAAITRKKADFLNGHLLALTVEELLFLRDGLKAKAEDLRELSDVRRGKAGAISASVSGDGAVDIEGASAIGGDVRRLQVVEVKRPDVPGADVAGGGGGGIGLKGGGKGKGARKERLPA